MRAAGGVSRSTKLRVRGSSVRGGEHTWECFLVVGWVGKNGVLQRSDGEMDLGETKCAASLCRVICIRQLAVSSLTKCQMRMNLGEGCEFTANSCACYSPGEGVRTEPVLWCPCWSCLFLAEWFYFSLLWIFLKDTAWGEGGELFFPGAAACPFCQRSVVVPSWIAASFPIHWIWTAV